MPLNDKTILTPEDCDTAVLFQISSSQLRNYLLGDSLDDIIPDFDEAAQRVWREVHIEQKGRRFIMIEVVPSE